MVKVRNDIFDSYMKYKNDKKRRRRQVVWYYIYRYIFMPNCNMKAFLWGAEKPRGGLSVRGRRSFITFCQDLVAISSVIELTIGLGWSGSILVCLLPIQSDIDGIAWFLMTLFLIIPIGGVYLCCSLILVCGYAQLVAHDIFRIPDNQ